MTRTTPVSVKLRRILPAGLLAATAIFGGSAIGDPASACAAPPEWDIGAFDQCLNSGLGKGMSDEEWESHYTWCCLKSGGQCAKPIAGSGKCRCVAPPAEPAEAGPGWVPPGGMPGTVPTHTVQPAEPAPNVPPTLAPASPG